MKIETIEVKKVTLKDGFYVEIKHRKEDDYYEFWLYNNQYGKGEFIISTKIEKNKELEIIKYIINEYVLQEIKNYISNYYEEENDN